METSKTNNNMKKIILLCGRPASGKTTIAKELIQLLRVRVGILADHVDGDELRKGLCSDLGYAHKDRIENHRRAAELCKVLMGRYRHVVVSMVAGQEDVRDMFLDTVGRKEVLLVHVDTDFLECVARDPKGLYTKESYVEFASLFKPPSSPDLVCRTKNKSPFQNANEIIDALWYLS